MNAAPIHTLSEACKLAHAAGWDAANRSARDAGRAAWTNDDWNKGAEVYARMMRALGHPVVETVPIGNAHLIR